MSRSRRSDRFAHLADAQLHEQLVLCRLSWLHAISWGVDLAIENAAERGHALASEHMLRGLDVETGRTWPSAALYETRGLTTPPASPWMTPPKCDAESE